jgi:hypothetical protein
MSERVGAHARVAESAPVEGGQGQAMLYIINLLSSTTPMALEVPYAPELEGFAVFRSRRVEDGRDRFRLHLGYFESIQEAERALTVVRTRYPAAWVALAPKDSMGSLDDTSVAQFQLVRRRRTQPAVAPAKNQFAQPAAPAQVAAPVRPVRAAPLRATLVAPAQSRSAAPSQAAQSRLSPVEVLQLLESAPRAARTVAPAALHEARAPNAPNAPPLSVASPQKFAVQLIWSTATVDAARVPQLAIFDAYTLYSVQVERAGRRWHGLRLGFFSDPVSARQVALYARSDFSAAAVVPVSERECAKANEVALAHNQRAGQPATPRKDQDTIELKEDDTPRTRSAPLQESLLAQGLPVMPASAEPVRTNGVPAKQSKPVQVAPSHRQSTLKRASRSMDDLLEELGAGTLDIEPGGSHEELSDSGVRHLSVSIVRRKSPLARLLPKVGRRRPA